uniref:zinc finger protein 260-like isoform X1 n=1 Tax=Scatophagus argus TaxID=75038 RepID=UPI001ED7D1CB|nr:zinc finger protein 260-like isoform X1 [Scatophagus argus]XP_046261392.1 zinc finger protein 260-like isoform X1 [Scatophagus argus]XP_046261393.1 zinc finger protein 260-like isoform X1 [Scatophagus argus]
MSDYLAREFRAQLAATMDSVLRRAMLEIMKIFEKSLHDHQRELVQKGEEIAQLKIMLQGTEITLREREWGHERGAEVNKTQMNELQREPKDVVNVSGPTADVPEIVFEVPDEWCAPLGSKTVTKQDNSSCPSVRLRQLYIPLCHIPVIKQEMENHDIESHQQKKDSRRSRRGSSLKERHKQTQGRSTPKHEQATRRPPVRNNMKILLQNTKQDCSNQMGRLTGLRRGRRNSPEKEHENTPKSKREEGKITTAESKSKEQEMAESDDRKKYLCKFCKKEFDTLFGRSVHVRSHKRCQGCKREFPFPSVLKCHKTYCPKLKKLLGKKAQSTDSSKAQSFDNEKAAALRKKQMTLNTESTPSSNCCESSIQKKGSTKKHTCLQCNKTFHSCRRMKEHMRVHTGEKPFPCSLCPKKFHVNRSLKLHVTRMHKDQVESSEANGGLSWTVPLEVNEDTQEDVISPSKNTIQEGNPGRQRVPRWQTMGTQCANGFTCLLCQKHMRNKYLLIEHFRIHTGEKPLKCDRCPAKFRFGGQLSLHKKKCGNPAIQCEKCERKFPSQMRYDSHVFKYHRDCPHFCKVCGKGFVTEGRLRNHMGRHL